MGRVTIELSMRLARRRGLTAAELLEDAQEGR
jgi:hypothetical protein